MPSNPVSSNPVSSNPHKAVRPDFLWGISSAATVIESRPVAEKPDSIWDVFAAAPGKVMDGSMPHNGPKHLEFWRSDIALLAELGVNAYRFSLSWTAIHHDPSAIDFYDQLLDALLAKGIQPIVTLTHYDMPTAIMEIGGWLSRDTAEIFADYATAVGDRLADRVAHWVTVNSPFVHTAYGYGAGIEAPGLTMLGHALQAGMYQLLGHGLGTLALRASGAASIGIANNHTVVNPETTSAADRQAAAIYEALHNFALADPLFLGTYPTELQLIDGAGDARLSDADLVLARSPIDFYGVNYYHPVFVAAASDNSRIPFSLVDTPGSDNDSSPLEMSTNGWPIVPAALTQTLENLAQRYPTLPPVLITEIGLASPNDLDDEVRTRFINDHVAAAMEATGFDLRGFCYWSLLDGWEFGEGLSHSYGLVAVDELTGERQKRSSFGHYRELIRRSVDPA